MVGNVAAIKVTGERVFVLSTGNNGLDTVYTVRRPVVGPNGIQHIVENFTPDELEAPDESIRRELNDILTKRKLEQELYNQFQKEQAATQASEFEAATEKTDDNVIKFTN
jgi:hypothetical protein